MKYVVNGKVKNTKNNSDSNFQPTIKVNVTDHPKNFEDVLETLGGFGMFQVLVMFLYLILEIPMAFAIFIPIFVGRSPEAWLCNNVTVFESEICQCNGTIAGVSNESIVSEWNLVCGNAWISDFITSVQMVGLFFGSIFGSQIADWYGRKSGFLLSILLVSLGSSVSAASPSPYVYAVSRFCSGAGIQCFINVTGAGVMEFMPPKFRSLANCIGPLGEGIMILSVISYYVRPWRTLYWITTAPFVLIIFIFPFLPESPRWLLRQNRVEEAHAVLNYVANVNRKKQIDINVLKEIAKSEDQSCSQTSQNEHPGYLQFLTDRNLRTTSLFIIAIWFAWSLTYYGISFNIKNLEGHIYINVFLKGVANALGQRATLLINDSMGRKISLFASMTFGAVFMVITAISFLAMGVNVPGELVLVLCLLSLFGMSATRSTSKLLTGESFPTNLRAMSFGISGIAITLGGVLSPQLAFLGSNWPAIPFFVFAIVSVGGSLVSFLMKETMGLNLDENTTCDEKEDEET
ncbi:solute carrier family 22 member 13 [Folsomia candida]|uniref:Organic cation transporter protein n=1 Tax=Folsomia candida TaxID=158441 RepID=A0A226EUQ7_FOLCA|nr:solute carrier family 22 member 13 [Folsomia candida]OXA60960.1 Organic cation transporter protein [Folsomia candida]